MRGPRHNHEYPDRGIDCEFELEPAFQDLVERAQKAGWSAQEAYLAIISLCENHAIGDMQIDALEAVLDEVRVRRV